MCVSVCVRVCVYVCVCARGGAALFRIRYEHFMMCVCVCVGVSLCVCVCHVSLYIREGTYTVTQRTHICVS